MATVTRRDLARALKERLGGTIVDNDHWIQAFVDVLSREISENERVEIRGFGSFNLHTIKAHTTVKPSEVVKDGEKRAKMKVPQTYTVDFRPAKAYKARLKKDQASKQKSSKAKKSK